MLRLGIALAVGFVLGLVSAIFIDTEIRLNDREGSRLVAPWVKFRIFVLYIWERKVFYLVLTAICLAAGLAIGSLYFLPNVEKERPQAPWWGPAR